MNTPKPLLDWAPIVCRLRRVKPLARLARELHITPEHIQRLARGEVQETAFSTGIRLLDLHRDHFPAEHSRLQLEERP